MGAFLSEIMAKWANDAGEVSIKIAVIGQPGSGKATILKQVANAQAQAAVRTGVIAEAEVSRTEFIWPDPIQDGPFVRVKVFALSGNPVHEAAEQMLLVNADALVFVVDCDPQYIAGSRDSLLSMMSNAEHVGLDWGKTVVVMQYNRAERYPQMKPEDLDQWLGIENGKVARFITASNSEENLGVAINDAVQKVIARLSDQVHQVHQEHDTKNGSESISSTEKSTKVGKPSDEKVTDDSVTAAVENTETATQVV